MPNHTKRVLVTGGAGFVGANLTRLLLEDGHEVHLLVRPRQNDWRIRAILGDVRLHAVELQDGPLIDETVKRIKPDWVFHLAANGAYSHQTDLNRIIQVNIQGTINLVQACIATGFEVFINTGSSSEYGFKDYAPDETDWLEPNSYYAVSKASASLFCRYVAQRDDLNIITLRLYSVYGEWEEPTRLIPALVMRGLHGKLPPLVSPDAARDFVYVDDVCRAYLMAAATDKAERGAIYNVGTGVQTSMKEVVEAAKHLMDIPDEPEWGSMPDRHWSTNIWVADNRKIREKLFWQPRYSFEAGLSQTIKWLRNNPEMYAFYKSFPK